MLIRNFKSVADEVAKRNLATELLQVEINNASILDDRISKYKNPNAPPPVPPQYKSNSDLQKDEMGLIKAGIDGLMEMNFDYAQSAGIVNGIKQRGGDYLVQFVSALPTIKADILKKFNPKLVSPQFFSNYLDNFFDELGVSYGFNFDKDGGLDVGSLTEIGQILPKRSAVSGLIDTIVQSQSLAMIDPDIKADTDDAIISLNNLLNALLTDIEEGGLNAGTLTQKQRLDYFKRIKRIVKDAQIPAPIEIREADKVLTRAIQDNASPNIFSSIARQMRQRFSGLTKPKLKKLIDVRQDLNAEIGNPLAGDIEEVELQIDENAPITGFQLPTLEQEQINEYGDYIKQQLMSLPNETEVLRAILATLGNIEKKFPDFLDEYGSFPASLDTKQLKKEVRKNYTGTNAFDIMERIDAVVDMMKTAIQIQNQQATNPNQAYIPQDRKYYKYKADTSIGFGVKSKTAKAIKKHFKEDEKFLKKVAEELEDDMSSSDEEVMKELKKHGKREKPYEAKIEKAVGAGYIHKRIPVKKIVGKGIEVEEQPTYRTFGKYVMHIPHLTDKNVLNLKYPSLGSIPSIKPMTISDDYKEFIIDVMNTGRVNEKAFNQLHTHEQKHFERITKGAGLIDTFKLKRTGDEEEKKEVDRFNLLRGNYLGGNNSADVVKELKGLVVKFINDGRIARNEGLNLLMELSI